MPDEVSDILHIVAIWARMKGYRNGYLPATGRYWVPMTHNVHTAEQTRIWYTLYAAGQRNVCYLTSWWTQCQTKMFQDLPDVLLYVRLNAPYLANCLSDPVRSCSTLYAPLCRPSIPGSRDWRLVHAAYLNRLQFLSLPVEWCSWTKNK